MVSTNRPADTRQHSRVSRRFRLISCLFVFGLLTTSPPVIASASPASEGGRVATGAPGDTPIVSPAGKAGEAAPAAEAPAPGAVAPHPSRTARIVLMALGTHKSYRIGGDHRVDVLIVSPESHQKSVLKMARAAYPDAKVFAYLNTMDVMLLRSPERPSFWKKHEDWFLHDADGERIRVRVRHYKGPTSRYGMNVAKTGWQEYLGRRAVELLETGYDGVQLDNVETDCSYKLRNVGRWISALPVEMTPEIWYRAEAEMLARIRKIATEAGYADREIIFNHIRAGEPQRGLEYLAQVDGANSENWLNMKVDPRGTWGWAGRMNLARQAGAGGKRINLLAQASVLSPEEALFTFSSYLLASGGDKTSFWYGKTYRAEEMRWFWFYDMDLGAPKGPMHSEGNGGVFRRDFDKGAVLVNPEKAPRTVDLGGTFLDDAFEPLQRVMVGPRRGAILIRLEGTPPPREVLQTESCLGPAGGTGAPSSGAPAGLAIVRGEGDSGGAAVAFNDTRSICRLPVSLTPGTYRVVVDGRGNGKSADAAYVRVGPASRRVAFGFSSRQVFQVRLDKPVDAVEVSGAEAGVIVDSVIVIRVDVE